jgi:hypothetical protein
MQIQETVAVTEKRYQLAGCVAIAQAILIVISIILGLVEETASRVVLHRPGFVLAPSSFLVILEGGSAVYTLTMFRRLLNERYDFHKVDTLITLSIILSVLTAIGDLVTHAVYVNLRAVDEPWEAFMVLLPYLVAMMTLVGIVDIMIGVRLLKIKGQITELLRTMAYLLLVGGICSVSFVLWPFAIVIGVVSWIVLGLIFLREPEEAEFV